jgi:hypothetical protein
VDWGWWTRMLGIGRLQVIGCLKDDRNKVNFRLQGAPRNKYLSYTFLLTEQQARKHPQYRDNSHAKCAGSF